MTAKIRRGAEWFFDVYGSAVEWAADERSLGYPDDHSVSRERRYAAISAAVSPEFAHDVRIHGTEIAERTLLLDMAKRGLS